MSRMRLAHFLVKKTSTVAIPVRDAWASLGKVAAKLFRYIQLTPRSLILYTENAQLLRLVKLKFTVYF